MGEAMAEVINLRLARKARTRADSAAQAAQNRAAHGQTGSARRQQRAEADRAARELDAHRRDKP